MRQLTLFPDFTKDDRVQFIKEGNNVLVSVGTKGTVVVSSQPSLLIRFDNHLNDFWCYTWQLRNLS